MIAYPCSGLEHDFLKSSTNAAYNTQSRATARMVANGIIGEVSVRNRQRSRRVSCVTDPSCRISAVGFSVASSESFDGMRITSTDSSVAPCSCEARAGRSLLDSDCEEIMMENNVT
jgi:hypothetical protein